MDRTVLAAGCQRCSCQEKEDGEEDILGVVKEDMVWEDEVFDRSLRRFRTNDT